MVFIWGAILWKAGLTGMGVRWSQNQIRQCNWFMCVSSGILSGSWTDSEAEGRHSLHHLVQPWTLSAEDRSKCLPCSQIHPVKHRKWAAWVQCETWRRTLLQLTSDITQCLWNPEKITSSLAVWLLFTMHEREGHKTGNCLRMLMKGGITPSHHRQPSSDLTKPVSSRKSPIETEKTKTFFVLS